VIPFTDNHGLRDYRRAAPCPPPPNHATPRRRWPVITLVLVVAAAALASWVGCHPVPLVVLVVPPISHDIGTWLDADLVCVAVPGVQAAYVQRRCLSMQAIRLLILTSHVADDDGTR
jgi:hypothetical protein